MQLSNYLYIAEKYVFTFLIITTSITVIYTLSLHDALPIFFWAIIVLGHVSENSQRLFLTCFNELHAGVVFPRAQRIFGFLGRVVILLIDECAGISDQATEQIRPKPAHGQRRRAARTAAHDSPPPGIIREGELGVGGFGLGVVQDRWQHFAMDESGQAIGHG